MPASKPIIFSAPMVRAILDGHKTQTRRVLKHQPVERDQSDMAIKYEIGGQSFSGPADYMLSVLADYGCKYRKGDLLWVRETWAYACPLDDNDMPDGEMQTYYRADGEPFSRYLDPDTDEWRDRLKWKPSIFMIRDDSRITLEVTAVKVERLQDISEDDAEAEGCDFFGDQTLAYRGKFAELWNSINGPGSWDRNDWVAAYSFRRVK